ncbi:hypothetical protein B0T11DRAFT_315230 [Plectosphaerella cucumerina]|uniref:Uncharacterized protein n=1 Tax=Plectosphaerella cucumerina TaxID=40658 RepID=A0A8K0TUI4_9PEZI|nr:hypothetical protein B0T11DRAFT_315230 [Plectosphaerella cucumerina]
MAMQFSSLETSMSPKLLLVQDGQHFDLRDFIAKEPNLAREALINGLFDIPLEDSHLHLILAQESIRRAATVKRDTTPYRLGCVLRDCGSDAIGQDTVEARLYKAGGPKAVAVYAAALQDKTKGEREKTLGITRVDSCILTSGTSLIEHEEPSQGKLESNVFLAAKDDAPQSIHLVLLPLLDTVKTATSCPLAKKQ